MAKTRLQSSRAVTKPDVDFVYEQPGSLPGTLNIEADAPPPEIVLIDYNNANAIRKQVAIPEDCIPYLDTESVSWIDVQGLGSEEILQRLGRVFNLHPLILEDIVNVPERPKVEDYEEQLVIIARMVMPKEGAVGLGASHFCRNTQRQSG